MNLFDLQAESYATDNALAIAAGAHQEPAPTMALRPYQREAVDAVMERFNSGLRSGLIVLPTGTGKTICFSHIIDRVRPSRVMVIAHRQELIGQACEKIEAVTGEQPDVEMSEWWADMNRFGRSRVICASVQTLNAGQGGDGRMTRFDPKAFGLLVIDEAHHATADTYRRIMEHFRQNENCKILGVTATPDRGDEEALGQVFDGCAYDYEIPDAIHDGWLVPVRTSRVHVESLDFSGIKTRMGDLDGGELNRLLEFEENLHGIADPTYQIAGDRKTLIFAKSIEQAERLAEILNRHEEGCARSISGKTPRDEREQTLKEYRHGEFRFLCNVGVFLEGYDEPGIQVVAMARPTKSRALYAQAVGRGTRPLPGLVDQHDEADVRRSAIAQSDKPHLEIIDFVGNSGKHKLISSADILGGNYTLEEIERAERMAEEDEEASDVAENLKQAREDIQAEIEERKRKEKEEAERRRHVIGQARFSKTTSDPFDVLDVTPPMQRGWDKSKPASQGQINAIHKFTKGRVDATDMSSSEASALLNKLIGRAKHGWCTYAQTAWLKRNDYPTKNVTIKGASQIMDAHKGNGWKKIPDSQVSEIIQRNRPQGRKQA